MALSDLKVKFQRANEAVIGRGITAMLDALGVGWRRASGYVFIEPPLAANGTSFWVNARDGSWRNEIGGDAGVDPISFAAYALKGSQYDGLKWVHGYLGWGEAGEGYRPPTPGEIAARKAEAERIRAEQAQARAQKSKRVFGHWLNLRKAKGTIVETYLREVRRIPLDLLGGFPHSLRFQDRAEHLDPDTGEVTEWAAMVALCMVGSSPACTHVSYLKPDGSGKAPVKPARKVFGPKTGAAIRLWHGRGDYAPSVAIKRGVSLPLIIGEGIETTLSVVAQRPIYRAEAWIDLNNLRAFVWPDYASQVVWLRENDQKPDAIKASASVEAHLRAEAARVGKKLSILTSEVGSDFNDWLKADHE